MLRWNVRLGSAGNRVGSLVAAPLPWIAAYPAPMDWEGAGQSHCLGGSRSDIAPHYMQGGRSTPGSVLLPGQILENPAARGAAFLQQTLEAVARVFEFRETTRTVSAQVSGRGNAGFPIVPSVGPDHVHTQGSIPVNTCGSLLWLLGQQTTRVSATSIRTEARWLR